MKFSIDNASHFAPHYSPDKLRDKLRSLSHRWGRKIVEPALLLYYTMLSSDTPTRDKIVIVGALGYLILPTDMIPDFVPLLGLTDDAAALTLALETVGKNITPTIRRTAADKADQWFGNAPTNTP